MTQRSSYAVGTGVFIVLGFAALVYLATQTTSLVGGGQSQSYRLAARFTNIGQLKVRAPVKVAGVKIGQVEAIHLDPKAETAEVELSIDDHYRHIPIDSQASIYTSGLLGDQYIAVNYGNAKQDLQAGETLQYTHPASQLEAMLNKFLGGSSADAVGGTYQLTGEFTNVGSLSPGSAVKLAGVPIGSVQSVTIDPVKLNATVVMAIDKRYSQIPDDSSAAVLTNGLLGPQFIALEPGGSPQMLKNGDELVLTQSAMQLEDLIGKFMVGGSSSGSNGHGGGSAGKH